MHFPVCVWSTISNVLKCENDLDKAAFLTHRTGSQPWRPSGCLRTYCFDERTLTNSFTHILLYTEDIRI